MARNIVVCCDGTGCQFGTINSNVVKLYSVLEFDPDRQIAFYGPGLGTMGAPSALTKTAQAITRLLGLAFGYGLTKNLSDAYVFLMNHYQTHTSDMGSVKDGFFPKLLTSSIYDEVCIRNLLLSFLRAI